MLLALAPMQDVTDIAFMRTLHRIGSLPDYFITPYFRSTPTCCAFAEVNLRCIEENETGVPIWAQIAGSDPTTIMRDCESLLQYPIAGIDLNAGCPSPLVNRNGAGAHLMRDLPLFESILQSMKASIPPHQWSVKCRLGWSHAAEELPLLLDLLQQNGPPRLCLHARTRQQGYRGSVDLETMQNNAPALSPFELIVNGDILTPADAAAREAMFQPAGLMIGRGAVGRPYIFRELKGGPPATEEEMKLYFEILIEETRKIIWSRHLSRLDQVHCNRMKKYLAYIYPHLPPEAEYSLRRCTSMDEMKRILLEGLISPNKIG